MPSKSPLNGLTREDLVMVPTIDAEAHLAFLDGQQDLSPEQEERTNRHIADAMAAMRSLRMARMRTTPAPALVSQEILDQNP